jgi:glucose-1-phosphatase
LGQVKTVLFDLGNVLAYIDFQSFWRELGFQRAEEIELFREDYTLSTQQYETGIISTADYLNKLHKVFNNKFTLEQIEQAFASIIKDPVEGIAGLVKRVAYIHQTALVSNTNEIHYKISQDNFDVLKHLHKHYLSYQLKVMKPDHGFYDAIISDQRMPPSQMLFIDDIDENIKAAVRAGMQALKFEGVDNLETSFKKLRIL